MPKREPRFWKIPHYNDWVSWSVSGKPVIVYKRLDGGEAWLSLSRFKLVKKGGKK